MTWRSRDNQEKQSKTGYVTDDKVHGLCMLDKYDYKNNLKTCNIYFFLTAEMVAQTYLNVTLYAR